MSWDAPQAEWWIALHHALDTLATQYPESAPVLSLVPEHIVMPEREDGPERGGIAGDSPTWGSRGITGSSPLPRPPLR